MNNNSNIFDKSQLIKCILDVFLNNDKNVIQHANSYIMEAESHHEFLPSLIEAFEAENVTLAIF